MITEVVEVFGEQGVLATQIVVPVTDVMRARPRSRRIFGEVVYSVPHKAPGVTTA